MIWIGLLALTIIMGLASRRLGSLLPGFVSAYAGDTLWATAAFLMFGLVFPGRSTWEVALGAMAFSVLVELSQLYHAPWIDSIRNISLGGLVLGHGFLWSDLACYAVGVGIGIAVELAAQGSHQDPPSIG